MVSRAVLMVSGGRQTFVFPTAEAVGHPPPDSEVRRYGFAFQRLVGV